jgi:hypothetical protein
MRNVLSMERSGSAMPRDRWISLNHPGEAPGIPKEHLPLVARFSGSLTAWTRLLLGEDRAASTACLLRFLYPYQNSSRPDRENQASRASISLSSERRKMALVARAPCMVVAAAFAPPEPYPTESQPNRRPAPIPRPLPNPRPCPQPRQLAWACPQGPRPLPVMGPAPSGPVLLNPGIS